MPNGDMELDFGLTLPRDALSVPVVRHLCRSTLQRLGVEDACVHEIELALSEASTNVLVHAAGPEDQYEVRVKISDDVCKIDVVDTGAGIDLDALPVEPPVGAESGRGIQLMRALVDELQFATKPHAGTAVQLTKALRLQPTSPLGRVLRRQSSAAAVDRPDG